MAARDHVLDAGRGVTLASDPADDVSKRYSAGGAAAARSTPERRPVIREWEFADGPVIVFSKLDSCLGAIQKAGRNRVRGAHFSQMIFEANGPMCDATKFDAAMRNAGFDESADVVYFGGSVAEWKKGLGQSIWLKAWPIDAPKWDRSQKRWIFEVKADQLTSWSF